MRCARAMREPTEENIAAIRDCDRAPDRRPAPRRGVSTICLMLAEALLMAGDVAGAEAALQEGFAFVEQSGERYWLADLHRLDGQIALKRPEAGPGAGGSLLPQGHRSRPQPEARMLELRAATDLARLWRDTGSPNDPRALLEPILAAIEGGETTRDVRNARALLAEIA